MPSERAPRPVKYTSRLVFEEALRRLVQTTPRPHKHSDVAAQLGVSDRSFYRLRAKYGIDWPPPEDTEEAADLPVTAWLVQYFQRHTLWVSAATAEEALAIVREKAGGPIRIIGIQAS